MRPTATRFDRALDLANEEVAGWLARVRSLAQWMPDLGLPGFDDAHVSLIAGGLARDGVQLAGAATLDEIQARVAARAAARPDAPGINGGGWWYEAIAHQPVPPPHLYWAAFPPRASQ